MPPQIRSITKATHLDPLQTRSVTKAWKHNSDLLVTLGTRLDKTKQAVALVSSQQRQSRHTERAATVELVDNELHLCELPKNEDVNTGDFWSRWRRENSPAGGSKPTHTKQFLYLKCKVRHANKNRNSTTVCSYMKSYHQKEINEFLVKKKKDQRSTISNFVTKRPWLSKTPCSKDDDKRLKQKLIEWLCKNLRPFSNVEDKKFREFCILL